MNYRGSYRGRRERQVFAVENFPEVFNVDSLLDVGGGQRMLKTVLRDKGFRTSYVSIDRFHRPHVRVDLNRVDIPFPNARFQTVVCLDVLEHLDPIHEVFDRLLGLSGQYFLISLPNNLHWFHRWNVLRGRTLSGKYGLPPEPPGDRHRWMLNYREARSFVRSRLDDRAARVVAEFPYYYRFRRWYARLVNAVIRRWGSENLAAWTYWCLIEKDSV